MPPLHPLPWHLRRLWGRSQTTYAQQKECKRPGEGTAAENGAEIGMQRDGRNGSASEGSNGWRGRTGLVARSSRCCWRGLAEGQKARARDQG